jgi:hypothetical protein
MARRKLTETASLLPATTRSGQRPSRSGALAFKWIRILFRCWKDRVAYDERKYLAVLAKRGSPLGKLLVVDMATCEVPCGS